MSTAAGLACDERTTRWESFIAWLKKSFGWLLAKAQTNATLGQSFVYADAPLPDWVLLGEYGNGGSKSAGRLEIVRLPTEDGDAIPIGLYRNGRFHAIHPDHLGTPLLITDEANLPVWQWHYTAFQAKKPTGVMKATPKPRHAYAKSRVVRRPCQKQPGRCRCRPPILAHADR